MQPCPMDYITEGELSVVFESSNIYAYVPCHSITKLFGVSVLSLLLPVLDFLSK